MNNSKQTSTNDRSWSIYLIAIGLVTIFLRFVNVDENPTINYLQVGLGSTLILYGLYKYWIGRSRSTDPTGR